MRPITIFIGGSTEAWAKAFALLAAQLNSSDDALRGWAVRGLKNLNTREARQALLDVGLGD